MSNKVNIEQDLREYLLKAENMRNEEKVRYLMALIDKHLEFQKLTHVIQNHEFSNIVGRAMSNLSEQKTNLRISGRKIDQYEQKHVAMIESVISYLNMHQLLKKQVEFNYTEEPNFESNEDVTG